jgi:hypothetical protein
MDDERLAGVPQHLMEAFWCRQPTVFASRAWVELGAHSDVIALVVIASDDCPAGQAELKGGARRTPKARATVNYLSRPLLVWLSVLLATAVPTATGRALATSPAIEIISVSADVADVRQNPLAVLRTDVLPLQVQRADFSFDSINPQWIQYVFTTHNPNPTAALAGVPYQVIAYDAADGIQGTAAGSIALAFASESEVVAGQMVVASGADVVRIEVQMGEAQPADTTLTENPLAVEAVNVMRGVNEVTVRVSGIVRNGQDRDLRAIALVAVARDTQDRIVASGSGTLDSLPALGSAGATVDMNLAQLPARAEMYAYLTGAGAPMVADPPPGQALRLIDSGFFQDPYGKVHVGFILENPNADRPDARGSYVVTAFDAENRVIGSWGQQSSGLVFPGQRLGWAREVVVSQGTQVASVAVSLVSGGAVRDIPGVSLPAYDHNPLGVGSVSVTVVNVTADRDYYDVRGSVTSSWAHDLANPIGVAFIVYDAQGVIMGGEEMSVFGGVPAGGQVEVTYQLRDLPSPPGRVEMYPFFRDAYDLR